ncbi:flagellar hook-basal body complex protein FliE [Halanaerobium salsuginis]|jgi:flagellar hook-basal body complex protein FliE|uniref:Flagellar hook-basal body complex protein FliE n=1 Tax=Halanaerobium salsuginis TaxID=29563 RepID=A0A1I4KH28_9FIRM|nr:flagellar hook-basal body complex protein FliE [Halanaerobium salsuginis]SFL78075.1 flagellar hook-basal body complex protein FliE [Halanaerobium salsuginis]
MEIDPIQLQTQFAKFDLEDQTQSNSQPVEKPFADFLKEKLGEVNNLQKNSEAMTASFAAGETDNIHDVMIAAEKAKIAVNLTTAVQNKVIDAYNEIMRLQV